MHVAGIGGIPSNLGWTVDKAKQFSPRLGVTYQYGSKTVVRAGYGRSFDTGVFGSIFGHTMTQNIPVLANQQLNSAHQHWLRVSRSLRAPPPTSARFPPTACSESGSPAVSSSSRPNPCT